MASVWRASSRTSSLVASPAHLANTQRDGDDSSDAGRSLNGADDERCEFVSGHGIALRGPDIPAFLEPEATIGWPHVF